LRIIKEIKWYFLYEFFNDKIKELHLRKTRLILDYNLLHFHDKNIGIIYTILLTHEA